MNTHATRSGRTPASAFQFDFSAGALCLDFVNTVPDRQRPSTDHLRTYPDLLAWARQGGMLGPGAARRLERRARRSPRQARAVLARAIAIREGLYRVFSALAAGRAPAASDVSAFNANLAQAVADLRVAWQRPRFAWEWGGQDRLDGTLGPVLRSAGDLLTSVEATHVKECASPTCSWLFIDRSRTGRRRWCSMQTCGNRNKARRHYQRLRQLGAGS